MGGAPVMSQLNIQRDKVITLYERGASIDELAEKFKCSNTPIRKLLLGNGVRLRPAIRPSILEKQNAEIVSLYLSGESTKALAEKFKVNRDTVSLFLKKQGIRRRAPLAKRTFHIERDVDKGMLAGLLVGEGSIIIHGSRVIIRIVNQESPVLGWLAKFGGKIFWSKPRPSAQNPCGVWDLGGAVNVFHCLVSIEHLLIGRKRMLARAGVKLLQSRYGFKEAP